jgi:D-3-phosphoglycerate dehydrogenase
LTALRILISTSSFGVADRAPLARLEQEGVEYRLNPHGRVLTEDEAIELLDGVDGVIAGTERLSERVLGQSPRLRVISRVGTGLEGIDLAAAERSGVRVFITPDALTDSVAELTLAGMLTLLRGIHTMDAALHAGVWEKQMGSLLRGKTVGIVGLGRIGKAVACLLEPFGVTRIARDAEPDEAWAAAHGVELVELEALLPVSDIVTIHASGRACLIGPSELAQLQPGSMVVNTARPWLVDEGALHAALVGGQLAGCYLDVFEREPYDGPLRDLRNAVLTPHVGSYAREARAQMEREAVDNLLLGLKDGDDR